MGKIFFGSNLTSEAEYWATTTIDSAVQMRRSLVINRGYGQVRLNILAEYVIRDIRDKRLSKQQRPAPSQSRFVVVTLGFKLIHYRKSSH